MIWFVRSFKMMLWLCPFILFNSSCGSGLLRVYPVSPLVHWLKSFYFGDCLKDLLDCVVGHFFICLRSLCFLFSMAFYLFPPGIPQLLCIHCSMTNVPYSLYSLSTSFITNFASSNEMSSHLLMAIRGYWESKNITISCGSAVPFSRSFQIFSAFTQAIISAL